MGARGQLHILVTTHGKRIPLLTRYEVGWAPGNREEMLAKKMPHLQNTRTYKNIPLWSCGSFLIKYTHVQKTKYSVFRVVLIEIQ